jgi:hypothetical protein
VREVEQFEEEEFEWDEEGDGEDARRSIESDEEEGGSEAEDREGESCESEREENRGEGE